MLGYTIKLRPTDRNYSRYIRAKAGNKCEYCSKDGRVVKLECSHFWSRGKEATRFDDDNCSSFCWSCHQRLGHGDGRADYIKFLINKLGQRGYDLLELKSNSYKKRDDVADKIMIIELLKGVGLKWQS